MESTCNICAGESLKIFDAKVLGKYKADYFQCGYCGFIQTEKPTWLAEAYVSAITAIDVGLVYRNLHFSNLVPGILDMFSSEKDSYLDYGGGYGLFVRMMRDKGYQFYLQDIYAENMFARYFESIDYKGDTKFTGLTAFEVFEHLENPTTELKTMFELSDTVIFSTDIQPAISFTSASDWWYFVPETGQHISFYSMKSLQILSEKFNCRLYSNKSNLHILTKLNLSKDPFSMHVQAPNSLFRKILNKVLMSPVNTGIQRSSLLEQDFQLYRSKLSASINT